MRTKLNNGFEYEYEAQLGLPKPLPKNEEIIWQGSPNVWLVAREIFYIRAVIFYFVALIAFQLIDGFQEGLSNRAILISTVSMVALSVLGIGLLAFLAICTAKTTIYTITNRRVVMRIGIVLTMTFNLPLKAIESADVLRVKKHQGNIALKVENSTKIAFFHLWPHARPWHFSHPQPMLLSIPEVEKVSSLLTAAWAAENDISSVVIDKKNPSISPESRLQTIRSSLRNESSNDLAQI
jgi:hypothetical protein